MREGTKIRLKLAALYLLGVPLGGAFLAIPMVWLGWWWVAIWGTGAACFVWGWNAAARYWWKHDRVDTL